MKIRKQVYSCNIDKNVNCKKNNCSKEYCTHTSQFKYAKKNLFNLIKFVFNKVIPPTSK